MDPRRSSLDDGVATDSPELQPWSPSPAGSGSNTPARRGEVGSPVQERTTPGGTRRTARFEIAPFTPALDDGATSPDWSPSTPNLAESYAGLKRNLSVKSLRELELKELQAAVWRRPGEGKKRPRDLEQALVHAATGGARSFILGFAMRAGVNTLMMALRLSRKRKLKFAVVLHALFGADSIRFGLLLGSFSFLFKATLHTLRLFNPGHRGLGKEEAWHAALAGAVSGLSVLAEKGSRRVTIGQQLFVRGLQGYYNILHKRGVVNIPNGDVIIFGLSCAQIMYSWLMSPEALPAGYRDWITKASRVPDPILPVNRTAHRYGTFDTNIASELLTWKGGVTPSNFTQIEEYVFRGENGDFGPPFAPCAVVHPWVDSCRWVAVDRWHNVFRWIFPVYAALHVLPPILLRRKVFMRDPRKALLKSFFGTLRSCSFLATFVVLFQGLVCAQRNWYNLVHNSFLPSWLVRLGTNKFYYWLSGFATCLALFIEEKKRRDTLALYVLPRGLEALWSSARKRSWVPFVPGGEVLLTSAGMGMVMSTYVHEPEMLSGLVRSVLYQLVARG